VTRAAPVVGAALLEIEGLTKSYGGVAALDSVSLSIQPGEIFALIGPNGSGKTTLVRAVLGVLAPDAGTVRRRPGLRLAYVPQQLEIDRSLPLTVGHFLTLGRRVHRPRLIEALGEVGGAELLGRPVHAISGGELRRVALARALLREPDLLVLDEPMSGVDVTGQADLYALIARIRHDRRCGVLLVSHDLHLVMSETDTVICLNRHVCCRGHPESVARDPAYMALFGPTAAAQFAVYAHGHDHVHGAGDEIIPVAPSDDTGGAQQSGG
jgi:zinc transport system ATP-binding protein